MDFINNSKNLISNIKNKSNMKEDFKEPLSIR